MARNNNYYDKNTLQKILIGREKVDHTPLSNRQAVSIEGTNSFNQDYQNSNKINPVILTPRGSLECNPVIPAFPGEEY